MGDYKKRNKPHWADFAIITAYETLDAEKCPKCQVPIWWAYSENALIDFEHDHIDCESCKWDEQAKKNNKQDKPGRTLFVKAVPVEGEDKLPTRADFQNEMLAKALKQKADSEK